MRVLIEAANATVAVEGSRIAEPTGAYERTIRLPDCELRPGLINAHDHLHRNHYGRLGAPPYANAYDWARDIQKRHAAEIARDRAMPRRQALLRGAWKNLLSGVTHVVHHDAWETDFEDNFPINVVKLSNADSLGMTRNFAPPENQPFALHVAEGADEAAADEIRTLAASGLLTRNLIAVHAVGVDADGVAKLRERGCAIVWCPSSNYFLFGRTAPEALLDEGTDILLGTDSLLTGAGTLLDELRLARHHISDARLLNAIGSLAADRLGLAAPALAPGASADLALFRRPVLEAELSDVMLVMVGGELRVLDPDIVSMLDVRGGQMLAWNNVRRWISEETRLYD
ncbi:MAG TPA: amidohydrolase family protein [Rhizomicrobium sp.]|jgi:cytosine/adenosine deaminase-related metal-dependent hydrolase